MKKKAAWIFILIIGLSCLSFGTMVMAEGIEGEDKNIKKAPKCVDTVEHKEEKESKSSEFSSSEMKGVQVPQKLEIVIDPWEIDGKGQIYSEKYIIRNNGNFTGTLTLSNLTCKPQASSGVVVRTDRDGLNDNKEKNLYMEMQFGDSGQIVMSEQSAEYQTVLKPNEELTVSFAGEINEYASEKWRNNDVKVSIVYLWDVNEVQTDVMEVAEIEGNVNEVDEVSEDVEAHNKENTVELGNNDEKETNNENTVNFDENKQIDDRGVWKENDEVNSSKIIELTEKQETKVVIDSWKVEAENQIISLQYIARNVGEKTGIFTLRNIMCQSKAENGITFKANQEVFDADEKNIYMEMIVGNRASVALAEECSEYRIELNPGDELMVQFVGMMNEKMAEEWEESSVVIEAVTYWDVEI